MHSKINKSLEQDKIKDKHPKSNLKIKTIPKK